MAKKKAAVVIRIPRGKPEGAQCSARQRKKESAVGGKSKSKKSGRNFFVFPSLMLQVQAGKRKCVSSAALCSQRYRTHCQGETGWRERECVEWIQREREGEWEVPDSER